jgi:protein gp37
MSAVTGIEWTDATVNFWWGCTKVGPGCDHCYAETWSERFGGGIWGVGAPRRKIKSAVKLIHRLDNDYAWWSADYHIGQIHATPRRRVFIQSMSDLFDTEVPIEWFDEAWGRIEVCDRIEIQIVTKRVTVVEKRLAAIGRTAWPKHAGLMISVVDQTEADRDIPRLLALKKRLGIPWVGLSIEPLLGSIVLRDEWLALLDWVIVGGESGKGARPMHPNWARSLRDQCAASGTPFFFKQWGEWGPDIGGFDGVGGRIMEGAGPCAAFRGDAWTFAADGYAMALEPGDGDWLYRLGKKANGRLLDGVEYNGLPA